MYSDLNGAANSQESSDGSKVTPPGKEESFQAGQTVCFAAAREPSNESWYAVRATQKRARKVYDALQGLGDPSLKLYFPLLKKVVYSNDDFSNPTKTIIDEPLDPNLLFVRCAHSRMLYYLYDETSPKIPGFTPYYNHCKVNDWGRNDLLIVPDTQMESFRIIVESGNENILIKESVDPEILCGDNVLVTGGPFAGVSGVVAKYKHQKRVFVKIDGLGCFATAYVPKNWLRKID